jgi:hypothetical protein
MSTTTSKATKFLSADATGKVIGSGYTSDGTVPAGSLACTAAQAAAWYGSTIVAGAIVAPIAPYVKPLPAQAVGAMAAGLAVVSTGTPALSATYGVDATTQAHIQAETMAILLTSSFADGTQSLIWPDLGGAAHSFDPVTFKAFAAAVNSYVAALYKAINGTATALPAATVTIP